jgi:Ca2+-binding EF-hand superfamily protein
MHKAKPLRKFDVTSDEIISAFSADDSPVPFATINQEMYAGGSITAPSTFSFTSELKMIRERVLAGLRQVDSGEVTPSTFQGMLFEMGIEPPELLLTMIQRKKINGTLDWKKVVRLLDDRVFKPMAMQTRDVADFGLNPLKNKFLDSLRNRGCRSLSDLAGAFRLASIDTDGSTKMLSFSDVKKSYKSLGLSDFSDDELRQFMVAFDKTGAGQVDTEKFIAFLRGPLSQQRNKFVLWAFRSMDKQGTSEFSVEVFVSTYDASFHPDVLSGLVTEKKVLLSFLNSFGPPKDISSMITRDEFFDFVGNLSVFIDDDDVFERMVKGSFNLGDRVPAPPEYQSSFGFEKAAFSGKQHHGDILSWGQEPSVLEKKSPEKTKKVARDFDRTVSVRSEFDRVSQASYKNSRYHIVLLFNLSISYLALTY